MQGADNTGGGLIRSDGTVAMTLDEVLTVYGLRIIYGDHEWQYRCNQSRRIKLRATREPGVTPFDPMRKAGMLREPVLYAQIARYNKGREKKDQIKSDFRPYNKTTADVRNAHREAVVIKNPRRKAG